MNRVHKSYLGMKPFIVVAEHVPRDHLVMIVCVAPRVITLVLPDTPYIQSHPGTNLRRILQCPRVPQRLLGLLGACWSRYHPRR